MTSRDSLPMSRPTTLNNVNWVSLCDWIHSVANAYEMQLSTIALIFQLICNSTSCTIQREHIQIRGCSCLYIASIEVEERPASLFDLTEFSNGAFTMEELRLDVQKTIAFLEGRIYIHSAYHLFCLDNNFTQLEKELSVVCLILSPTFASMKATELKQLVRDDSQELYDTLSKLLAATPLKHYPEVIDRIREKGRPEKCKVVHKRIEGVSYDFKYKNDFIICNKIGVGGKSIVYTGLRKGVLRAVKEQPSSVSAIREISALCALAHPNVIKIHEFCFTSIDHVQIDLELGTSLDKLIYIDHSPQDIWNDVYVKGERRADRLPNRHQYLRQITLGLSYIHEMGILHRDLKVANIVVVDGVCKIIDFDASTSMAFDRDVVRETGLTTHCYCSPEILFLDNNKYLFEPDIWSLGAVALELETSCCPFFLYDHSDSIEDIKKSIMNTMICILGTPPDDYEPQAGYFANDLPTIDKAADEKLRPFIKGCLSWMPNSRPMAKDAYTLIL